MLRVAGLRSEPGDEIKTRCGSWPEHQDFALSWVDPGQSRDVHLVRDQHQNPRLSAPLFNKPPNRTGLHSFDILLGEERVERWKPFDTIPKREPGCVEAAAPLAGQHALDSDVVGFEPRTNWRACSRPLLDRLR